MRFRVAMCVLLSFLTSVVLQTQALANKSGVSPNVLSLPSGPGSLGGVGENVQANLNMGLMSYAVKIVVPQGRGSATPTLGLSYSSSGGSGLMGIGWSFGAGGSISRLTVRGLPTYKDTDKFYAGGELVKIPNSPFYRARVEGGFVRYQWKQPNSDQKGYWIAEYPDGSKGYFGANSKGEVNYDAQVYGIHGTFQWELVTMVDRNGNRIEYSYFKDSSKAYLDKISWVFDKDNKPLYQVSFLYEGRSDIISDGKPGFDLKTLKRVKEIQITSANKRFRSYHFTYEDSTGLSRLINVKRYGRDAAKMYPVNFTMKYSDASFSSSTAKLVTMPTALGINFKNNDADFVDINGDGLPDVIDTSKAKHIFHINQLTLDNEMKPSSHDFPKSNMIENPTQTSAKLSNSSVQMLDFNGDGFTDMVDAVNRQIYLNKGNGKWEPQNTSLQSFPVTGKDVNMRFFDYNGDKAIDVVSSDGDSTTYWVSDGKGNWSEVKGGKGIGLSFSKDKVQLIDMNGDGLQDAVHITKNSLRYKKYLGYGQWTEWIDVKVPGIDKYELSTKAQFADINGDGMADMVAFLSNSLVYFVNKNSTEFKPGVQLNTIGGSSIPESTQTVRIVDINGNGSRDIVWLNDEGKVTYLELFNKRPNLMTEISNGIGQRINVAYGSSVYFYLRDKTCNTTKDKACEGPWMNKMPMAFTVVTQITTWASQSNSPSQQAEPTADERPITQKIYYHNGFYDGIEKKFRGYRKVESVQVGDDSVASRHSLIEYNVGDTDSYFHGKMLRAVVKGADGNIFNESKTEWKDCGTPAGVDSNLEPPVRFICNVASETVIKEGGTDSSKWKTTRNEVQYDGFGNVVLSANLGEKSKSGDELYTKKTFITPTDPKSESSIWILRAISKSEVCEKENGPCVAFQYYYDGEAFQGLPLGQLTKGNMTRTTTKKSLASDDVITPVRRKFDSYGNVIEKMGPTGQRRTYEWDATYHRFAVKETVYVGKLSFSASAEWDYSNNSVIRSTNFNGHVSRYTYDSFGRITATYQVGDPDGKPTLSYTYELKAPMSRIVTTKRTQTGGLEDRKSITCFDGLGRTVNTRTHMGNNKYLIHSHVAFNAAGSHSKAWDAYESDETCTFTPPKDSKINTTLFHYDALGRLIKKTLANGTFGKTVYEPFKVVSYDEADTDKNSPHYNTPSTQVFDGLNRLVQDIVMPALGKEQVTTYTYTGLNSQLKQLITSMTLPDGSVKKHEYNLLGFTTKVTDPDRSTIEFKYNDNGNMIERKDARGLVTTYTYDEVGRILSRQQKGDDSTKVTYTYDTVASEFPQAKNLKGRLVQAIYPNGSTYYSYTDRGEENIIQYRMLGTTFEIKRTFDNTGKGLTTTYPDGRTLKFVYDKAGRLSSIPGFIKSISFAPTGEIASRTSESGVTTSLTFDLLRRLKKIQITSNPGFVYQLSYDNVGNILTSQETYREQSIENAYQYDALYRLTQASLGGGKEVLNYSLNHLDNITSKVSSLEEKSPVHIGAFQYDAKKIHAATQAGKLKMEYDPSGLMTKCGPMQMTWDYLGRMKSLTSENQTSHRFWYDEDYSRMAKESNGVHSFYPLPDFRIQRGYVSLYIMLNGYKVGEWRSSKFLTSFYDNLVADDKINGADAWLYHASRTKIISKTLKKRTPDIDLTRDMLLASAHRMLTNGEDEKFDLHTDHLGSIRLVTDQSGQVLRYKRYYPYGAIQAQEGHLFALGFQGTERDNTNLNYFGARYLDTRLGKWLSPDPAFEMMRGSNDEINSYASVTNNPMRFRDLGGFASEDSITSEAIGVASAGIASSLGFAGWQLYQLKKNRHLYSKQLNVAKSGMVAGSIMGGALGAASLALNIMGSAKEAALIGFAGSLVSAARSAIAVYSTIQQHNFYLKSQQMSNAHPDIIAEGKRARKKGILFQSAGVAASLISAGASAYTTFAGENNAMGTMMTSAAALIGAAGTIAASIASTKTMFVGNMFRSHQVKGALNLPIIASENNRVFRALRATRGHGQTGRAPQGGGHQLVSMPNKPFQSFRSRNNSLSHSSVRAVVKTK